MHHFTEQNVRIVANRQMFIEEAPPRYAETECAMWIAEFLMGEGAITYERADADITGFYELTATLSVVDTAYVKTMQERISDRQFARANELASRVTRAIEAFGPYDTVQKHVAIRIIHDALHDMQKTD